MKAPEGAEGAGFSLRGPVAGLLLAPAAAAALLGRPLIPEGSLPSLVLDVLAWLAFAAGGALRVWATLYLGGRKVKELVTGGPYSVCRHPLYLGSLLIGTSACLFLHSLVLVAALCLAAAFYAAATIPAEERLLSARHGAAFEAYRARVPPLWPRPSLFTTPGTVPVLVEGLRMEAARATRWALLPLLGAVLRYLRAQPSWPELFRLP